MFGMKKIVSFFLSFLLVASAMAIPASAGNVNYTTETTKEGWIKVINEGGAILGYSPGSGLKLIEADGFAFKDSNRNGVLDPYEDWRLDAETRAADLAQQIPSEWLPGIMLLSTQGGRGKSLTDEWKASLGDGTRTYDGNASTVDSAIANVNEIQAYAEALDYGIPVDFHAETGGGMSVKVGSKWPEPLSVGASFDPSIAEAVGNAKSTEYRSVGITTVNSPQIDLATEPRWSRISGTFTEDPLLAMDMAKAYVNGLQSTFDENGEDLGWGAESLNATIKHFPGNGNAEAGREAHNDYGKYNVYPGDNFYTQLLPFKATLELDGKTGSASSLMPDYGIGLDENGNPIGDDRVATGFNYFTITEILREEMGFDGLICTDYDIVDMRGWGLEDASEAERIMWIVAAGCDIYASYDDIATVREGLKLYEEKVGAEAAEERYRESARRIVRNMIQIGLLDQPYLEKSVAMAATNNEARNAAAYQAQLKTITMVKNAGNLIQERSDKPTVYIPLEYTAAVKVPPESAGSSADTPASGDLPIDIRVLSKFLNVVTDTVASPYTGPADEDGNPTMIPEDIIRASAEDIAKCDFALVIIDSPSNDGGGFDKENNEYLPLSLQYGPYTANSIYVRQQSLGGDIITVEVQDTYGAQVVKTTQNRSYYGKSARIKNADELDKISYVTSVCENVVVLVRAGGPMIFSEFENKVDAILMTFGGVSDEALCEVIVGKFEPCGLLPVQMPANMDTVEMQYEDVPRDMECHVDSEGNTYDFAFGMNCFCLIHAASTEKYSVEPLVD